MINQIGLFTKAEVSSVPNKPGIYFVLCNKEFERLKGRTNIIYIGKANNLAQRLTNKRNALPRFTTLRKNGFELKFIYKTSSTQEQARLMEISALQTYERKHLELPPLNHSN
jgi:excinuclease UvrABC nuclease subunit